MGIVYLDGELVDFQGNQPSSVPEAWRVIDNYLGSSNRVLERTVVDGCECDAETASGMRSFEKMEFFSLSIAAKLFALGGEWTRGCSECLSVEGDLSSRCLSSGWDETQKGVVEFLEKLRPFVENFSLLENYCESNASEVCKGFVDSYRKSVSVIENLIQSIESRSSVRLSDCLAFEFFPAWCEMLDQLNQELLPSLERDSNGN